MFWEYVAIGTTTSAWQKANVTCLTERVLALLYLLLNTHACIFGICNIYKSNLGLQLFLTRATSIHHDEVWDWSSDGCPVCLSSSLKTNHTDGGKVGDRRGLFTINKTRLIHRVITGSSNSPSLRGLRSCHTWAVHTCINICPEWSDLKWTALSRDVNAPNVSSVALEVWLNVNSLSVEQSLIFECGLRCIWPHSFNGVYTTVLLATPKACLLTDIFISKKKHTV